MAANEKIGILLKRYLDKTATPAEREELFACLQEPGFDEPLRAAIEETWSGEFTLHEQPEEQAEAIFQRIIRGQAGRGRVRPLKFLRYAAAAVIIMALGWGSYLAFFRTAPEPVTAHQPVNLDSDIAPGKEGAILTLPGGRQIVLDDAADGKITEAAVKKGNLVSYEDAGRENAVYNTMTTPRGRQFSLVLADGTRVWLNAESSITYPTAFVGNVRWVKITGEVYFEVTQQSTPALKGTPSKGGQIPFLVEANGVTTEVLGTHFNVNSYGDEGETKVTLLEGSVEVKSQNEKVKIRPGQQAVSIKNEKLKIKNGVDVEQVMAWKNGYFAFRDADIRMVMKQLTRWYDMEVEYRGTVPKQRFNGEIGRNLSLKEVLEGLAFTSQHFKIEEGRKLIITQ